FALKTAHGRLVAKEDHLAVGLRTDLGADRCLRYGSPAYRLTLLEGDAPAEAATDPEPTLADVGKDHIAVSLVDPALQAGIAIDHARQRGARFADQHAVGRGGGTAGQQGQKQQTGDERTLREWERHGVLRGLAKTR